MPADFYNSNVVSYMGQLWFTASKLLIIISLLTPSS